MTIAPPHIAAPWSVASSPQSCPGRGGRALSGQGLVSTYCAHTMAAPDPAK